MLTSFQRWVISALLIASLAACANGPGWARPGATNDAIEDALADCRALARTEVNADLARDQPRALDYGYGESGPGAPSGIRQFERDQVAIGARKTEKGVINGCMRSKGFTPQRSGWFG